MYTFKFNPTATAYVPLAKRLNPLAEEFIPQFAVNSDQGNSVDVTHWDTKTATERPKPSHLSAEDGSVSVQSAPDPPKKDASTHGVHGVRSMAHKTADLQRASSKDMAAAQKLSPSAVPKPTPAASALVQTERATDVCSRPVASFIAMPPTPNVRKSGAPATSTSGPPRAQIPSQRVESRPRAQKLAASQTLARAARPKGKSSMAGTSPGSTPGQALSSPVGAPDMSVVPDTVPPKLPTWKISAPPPSAASRTAPPVSTPELYVFNPRRFCMPGPEDAMFADRNLLTDADIAEKLQHVRGHHAKIRDIPVKPQKAENIGAFETFMKFVAPKVYDIPAC